MTIYEVLTNKWGTLNKEVGSVALFFTFKSEYLQSAAGKDNTSSKHWNKAAEVNPITAFLGIWPKVCGLAQFWILPGEA